MKLYDMIQVYSSGSTVIMHMHYIWPVLHTTSCLVAINKNRDMCFDMKNGKNTYFSGEIPVNDCRNVWRGLNLKSIRLIKKFFLRISKVSCKESSRSQSLKYCGIGLLPDLKPSQNVPKDYLIRLQISIIVIDFFARGNTEVKGYSALYNVNLQRLKCKMPVLQQVK